MNPFSLEGKTAIVTGGSPRLRHRTPPPPPHCGAPPVITPPRGGPPPHPAGSLGANCLARACDNADPASIATMIASTWELGPVDILVNNAGISPYYKRAELVTVDEWDAVVDVNLRGTYFASVEFARRAFEAGRPASIINVSSVLGIVPGERLGVYSATKAGIHQFTKVMALEWAGRNIRVNAIAPGWVETDFTAGLFASRHGERLRAEVPMGRLAQPGDIAAAAVWLASDAANYVTGSIVVIDGGRQLR